jgi:hypothetical protein
MTMPHLHRAHRYRYRGKPDSVTITCRCGETEVVGTWYITALAGWDPDHWRLHGHRKVVDCAKRGDKATHRRIERENRREERAHWKRENEKAPERFWRYPTFEDGCLREDA